MPFLRIIGRTMSGFPNWNREVLAEEISAPVSSCCVKNDPMKLLEVRRADAPQEARDPRTAPIVVAAIEVHRHLGPGLLESTYEECLCHELHLRGLSFRRQVPLPIFYKGLALDCKYQIDLLVEEQVVVELKSVESILPVHQAQLLTYMKLAHKNVGLLINFNVPVLTQGIVRRVL